MAMNARPESSPMSWIVQMLGWLSADAAWASRWKAREHLRVPRYILGKKLERDETPQARVFRLIDHAHPTAAEFLDNAVVRDGVANKGWGIGHLREEFEVDNQDESIKLRHCHPLHV
jgi:hypothetical protein